MGWKGTVRSIGAAYRRAERDNRRRQRELERQLKDIAKREEIARAALEVATYENYVGLIVSVHRECGEEIDWQSWVDAPEPLVPPKSAMLETEARDAFQNYEPGLFDRLFRRVVSRRAKLKGRVERAKRADEAAHQSSLKTWNSEHREWEKNRDLATRVLKGSPEALMEAIKKLDPFGDIIELGSKMSFFIDQTGILEVTLHVHGDDVIPRTIKSQLKSGRLSVKEMPKGRFNELFQDYVCSCTLRVANEIFSILPVDRVLVNACDKILNSQTGHLEEAPILSALISKETLAGLNMARIDPSDSMSNFVHRMNFKRTPLQQNLWVNSRSGRSPSAWYREASRFS